MPRYYGIQERDGHAQAGNLTMVVPLSDVSGTDEIDTGFDLKPNDIVKNVYLRVYTEEATASTKTIDVGLLSTESGGDADGFLDGVSTAAAGSVLGSLASGGQTLGTLLHVDESGGGVLTREQHVVNGTAVSISYTLGEALTEGDLDIVIEFYRPNAA